VQVNFQPIEWLGSRNRRDLESAFTCQFPHPFGVYAPAGRSVA
jgi:hypothetical protein